MKKFVIAGVILTFMLGGAAYPVAQGLRVPGDLMVTGVATVDSKLFAPLGINADGSTVEAGFFIGDGSALSNVPVAFAPLSGTAEFSSDLIISGQARGDIIYFNGANWVKLPAGTSGYRLQTAGPGADPYWSPSPWILAGNTIEATNGSNNLALNSDSLLILDNSRTKYLTWSSADDMFEFNDDVFINNAFGNFVGDGSSLTSLDASSLFTGVVSVQRGGTGNDTTTVQGSLLYNDGSKWVPLTPGTDGFRLATHGVGAAPTWVSPFTGVHLDAGPGLSGGPVVNFTGTFEVKFDRKTINLDGNGSLEVEYAPTANYAALAGAVSIAATVSDGAITASKLSSGSVTSGAIALNTITAANMGTASVTQDAIAAGSPTTNYFLRWNGNNLEWANPGTLTGSIELDETTIGHNINGSIEVMPGGLDASRYGTGSVTSGAIALNTITAANLATGSVTSDAIGLNTIAAANLANGSVTSGAIALNTITAANMGIASITKDAFATSNSPGTNQSIRWDGSDLEWFTPASQQPSTEVDNITIGNNTFGSHEVLDFGITTEKIADNAVTAAKMATGSVTADALANDAVYTNAIQNLAVTDGKIANATIDGTKLTTGINISTTGYITAETIKATHLYGDGANVTGITALIANYAVLAGTASQAADLNLTGQATGDVIFFNGTKWATLEPGTAGSTLRSGGPGAFPSWATGSVKVVGTTIESQVPGYDLALNSGSKLILDNSFSKYLMWNQVSSRFEFNDNLFTSGSFIGNGSQLTSLSATNISTGILGLARGGLGSDTAGTAQGSVLYNDGTKWVALAPSTSGEALLTQGPSANPVWGAPGSVTQVNTGRGLTGGPITSTGTLAIDMNVVVTTADAQVLTNKTINSSVIGDATTINTTGIATFGASGLGLDVYGTAEVDGYLIIGGGTLDATNPERLMIDAGTSPSVNVMSGYGDLNNYLELNIHNRNSGAFAQSDLVASANNDTPATPYFVDLGINSSGYNNPSYAMGPNDGHLVLYGNNFLMGTAYPGSNIVFFTGGTEQVNKRMLIDGNGNVAIGTSTPDASSLLTVAGGVKVNGAVTAESFAGNGSALTGVTPSSGSITAANMTTGSVTSDAILNGTIINADINGSAAIAYSKLNLSNSIVAGDLTSNSVTGAKIASNTITAANMGTASVTSDAIAANAITGSKLAGNSITATNMATGSVTSDAILDGTIINADINGSAAIAYSKLNLSNSIVAGDLTSGSVTGAKIANSTITAANMGTASVTSDAIAANAIIGSKLAGNSITAANMATGSVTSDAILDGTIVAADIAGNTITAAKMATGSVTSDAILNGTIVAADIAGNTITAAKMATGSVTSDAILDGTIVAADIAANAITAAKMATSSVTSDAIAANAVTAAKMGTGSVTSDAILDGTIVGGDLASAINISTTGYITSETLKAVNVISTVATGTQPYAATSTTVNTNLNADMVDGKHVITGSTQFNGAGSSGPFTITATGCTPTSNVQANFSVNPSLNRSISLIVPGTNSFTISVTGNLTVGTNNYTVMWLIIK